LPFGFTDGGSVRPGTKPPFAQWKGSEVDSLRPAWLTDTRGFLLVQIVYVVGFSVWAMSRGIAPSLELLLVLFVSILLWRSQDRALLRGLMPLFLLLLCFRGLRSFADNLNIASVHSQDLIGYERALFGGEIPAILVQAHLSNRWFTVLLDIATSLLYMSHFPMPVLMAVLLWHRDRSEYNLFVFGLLLLSYAAFVTFVLFPAAPPWWAAEHGHLPAGSITLKHFVWPGLIEVAGPNTVAAMPSLHMAYPVLIVLFCLRAWGRKSLWTMLLPLAMVPTTLYLGHHYVIDFLAGVFYAIASYGAARLWHRYQRPGSAIPWQRL